MMLPLCRCNPGGFVICKLDHMLRLTNESKAATLGKDIEPYILTVPTSVGLYHSTAITLVTKCQFKN